MDPETPSNPESHMQGQGGHEASDGWKKRAPYRIHESNDNFQTRYEANCHCGKVKYQLSREEPLDSKLCHCTTCQTQHGGFLYDHFSEEQFGTSSEKNAC
jgi:hypothetical protein